MAERRKEFWAGIFLILGVLVLLVGIAWLKDVAIARNIYPVKVVFRDTGGLRVGDPVDIAGVLKGKVARIELRPQDVLVTLEVERDVFLPKDSRITMRSRSLFTGEKYIKIDLGSSSEPADPKVPLHGGYYDEFSIAGLTRTLSRLDGLLAQVDVGQITKAIDKGIAEMVESSKESLSAFRELEQADLASLIDNLARVAAGLDTLLTAIREEEGTLGRYLFGDSTYNQILGASQELRALIADIRANPERYLHITIF